MGVTKIGKPLIVTMATLPELMLATLAWCEGLESKAKV